MSASSNFYEQDAQPDQIVDGTIQPQEHQTEQAEKELGVTIVPVSVTEDPWASAFAVQAAQDVWASLRQQLGPRKKASRRR